MKLWNSVFTVLILSASAGYADSLTLTGPGLSHHGLEINTDSRKAMRNKLTADGAFARHPVAIGLHYKRPGFQLSAGYLQDCFKGHAGLLTAGPSYQLFTKHLTVGAIAGVYTRETVVGSPIPVKITTSGVDIIPMAGLTASVNIPITSTVGIEVNALSNFYISHGNVGLRIDF